MVSEKLKEEYTNLELEFRFAMVAYRDYGDVNRLKIHPFSSDPLRLSLFLSSLTAYGGSDTPENVLGALNAVALMEDWQSQVRFCVLIGDAPGHGHELNTCSDDRFDQLTSYSLNFQC